VSRAVDHSLADKPRAQRRAGLNFNAEAVGNLAGAMRLFPAADFPRPAKMGFEADPYIRSLPSDLVFINILDKLTINLLRKH
jgi:hypothetical protein